MNPNSTGPFRAQQMLNRLSQRLRELLYCGSLSKQGSGRASLLRSAWKLQMHEAQVADVRCSDEAKPMPASRLSGRTALADFRGPQWLMIVTFGCLMFCGCSRSFWRSQADFDAYNLLSQKQFDERWVIPRTSVEPDERSRFYDPYDRDKPPLPPDDPSAARYMEWVNGMRGYKSWHKFGRLMSVENPQWLANFGVAPDTFHDSYLMTDGITVGTDPSKIVTEESMRVVPTIENLTLAQTIELASIHSRDYQTQLENLYLSALQLSLDQFQFQVRYLFGHAPTTPSSTLPGTSIPTGILNNSTIPGTSNTLGLATAGGVSQALPTGGQWIVGLANNTLWLFSGGQHTTSQSLLSYSLVQPLLAGAGRKFFLENLTFSERNVLYNTRILARYRRLFFADTVVNTAGGSVSSPVAISATSTSSVTNPAVISTNQGVNVAAGTTVGTTAANANQSVGGYLGLLYLLQVYLNQHENVELYRTQTLRLQELVAQTPFRRLEKGALPNGIAFPAALADKIEYSSEDRRLRWKITDDMTEQERDQLLALNNDPHYQTAIKEIFVQLRIGVTTLDYLQVATNLSNQEVAERRAKFAYDDEIDQFKFFIGVPTDMQVTVDRSLLAPFVLTDPGLLEIEKRLLRFVTRVWRLDEANPSLDQLRLIVQQFALLKSLVGTNGIEQVEVDLKRVEANMPNRMKHLLFDQSRETVTNQFERDKLIYLNVRSTYGEVTELIERWKRDLEEPDVALKERKAILSDLKDAREDLLQIIQNLRVLQMGLRTELVRIIEFPMTLDEAVDTAVENRFDLMNSRARVMDARRNMEVAANRLEAILNVVAQGSLNTPAGANHPLDFSGASSNFQIGLQMAAPLDQVQVRNAYRQSIVNYQQARRAYMLLEDQVKYDIRTSWRQLMMNRQNIETTRKALRQAALQLDINVANNLNPKLQVTGQAGTTNLGNTGLNLINVLSTLLTSQNNLIQSWALYERNRINIYRDMDIMQIDERGLWIDPFYQNLEQSSSISKENESAHDVPPQPSPTAPDAAASSRSKRSTHPGIVRLGSFSPAAPAKTKLDERDSAGRSGAAGSSRVGSDEIRLVSDLDGDDPDPGRDGRSGPGRSEDRDVPDNSRREGNARQYEERSPDQ